jgi:hypothetical protein
MDTADFERDTALRDWDLPLLIEGIVVLLERCREETLPRWLLQMLRPSIRRTLAWVDRQRLPYVVAAMGYDDSISVHEVRRRYGLAPTVRVIRGPPPTQHFRPKTDYRNAMSEGGGLLAMLLGGGDLRFDAGFAVDVLRAMCREVATPGSPGRSPE